MITPELQVAIDRRKRMLQAALMHVDPAQMDALFETIDAIAEARAREACVFAMSSLIAALGGDESDLREHMAQFALLKQQGKI